MRRVTAEELAFYDRLAGRISGILGDRACPFTQSSLAQRIGWNRASLCNFVNRIDKSIAAHFIPRIAHALKVSIEQLVTGDEPGIAERTTWDPRCDEADVILGKMSEWRRRNVPWLSLSGIIPTEAFPNHAMVANFVDSIVSGASPAAAERWHEVIESLQQSMKQEGEAHLEYIIPSRDLQRLTRREPPYHGFSSDEVVHLLENLKQEWVRQRDLRIIAVDDSTLSPDARLELASNLSLSLVGRETQIRCRRDLRTEWSDNPNSVAFSRDCMMRLKRSAGFGPRERPSAQHVYQLIDELLLEVQTVPTPAAPPAVAAAAVQESAA